MSFWTLVWHGVTAMVNMIWYSITFAAAWKYLTSDAQNAIDELSI